MINRASLSPCPAMAHEWRLGRLETTATVTTQATCGSMTGMAVLGLKLGADIDGEAASDRSGVWVSLSSDGTRVAIGANLNAATVTTQATCGSTTTMAMLGLKSVDDIDGEAADDQSGFSVSLSSDGTRVAIGAPAKRRQRQSAGHVRVYEYSGGGWAQLGTDIDGEAANDQSGYSVSLSSDGTRVAIGALANDGNGSSAGHVRVYEYSGGGWAQVGGRHRRRGGR